MVKVFVFDLKYFAASKNLVEFCKESADSLFSQKSDAVRKNTPRRTMVDNRTEQRITEKLFINQAVKCIK